MTEPATAAHSFLPVAGHPDDDECTYREDGTDATYCGESEAAHQPDTAADLTCSLCGVSFGATEYHSCARALVTGRLPATSTDLQQPLSDGATSVLNLPITVSREDRETDLTRSEAEACLQRLRDSASITWQWVTKAYLGRAWLALGYVSWDAMCDGELGGMRLRLPREERREIVGSLRDQGMSTRAIGAALGVHHDTVANDLGPVGNPTPVTGLDGKTYTPPARVDRTTGVIEDDDEVVDAEIVEDEPVPSPERPAAATSRAPRTDVVGTVNVALSRARDAADAARQISPAHLRDRGEEAAVWARDLSLSIEAMSGLLSRLQEATQ